MKIERLDAHDRLEHLQNTQADLINQGCIDCLTKNEDSLMIQDRCPYVYVFAHARTADNGSDKRMLFQPRMIKPPPQTNSYLFRTKSKSTDLEVCWILPPRELWPEFKKGNMIQDEAVVWSINQFVNNRAQMSEPFPDDFSKERADAIWLEIAKFKEDRARTRNFKNKLEATLRNVGALTTSPFLKL